MVLNSATLHVALFVMSLQITVRCPEKINVGSMIPRDCHLNPEGLRKEKDPCRSILKRDVEKAPRQATKKLHAKGYCMGSTG